MKPRFYTFCISAIVAVLLLHPVLNAFAGDILYEDDFTNLDPSWGTPGDILSVKDGKLVLKPALNTTQSVLNQSNVFDDADIEVEVTFSSGDPIVAGGLIFWAKDYTNFYCLCIDAQGSFKISHFVTDRWLNPVGWTESEAINKGIGQVNKLRVVTKGRQATAFINDKQVIVINGQPPQGGGCVGISGGSAQDSQNTWQFANLRVIATASAAASSPAPAPSRPGPAGRVATPWIKHHRKRIGADTLRRFLKISGSHFRSAKTRIEEKTKWTSKPFYRANPRNRSPSRSSLTVQAQPLKIWPAAAATSGCLPAR